MLDPSTLLLSGIGAVTTALVWVSARLWDRAQKCEESRDTLGKRLDDMAQKLGEAIGALRIYERCGIATCPFRARQE